MRVLSNNYKNFWIAWQYRETFVLLVGKSLIGQKQIVLASLNVV